MITSNGLLLSAVGLFSQQLRAWGLRISVNFKFTTAASFFFSYFRWVFLCMDSWEDHLNPFSHTLHLKGRRSSWVLVCSAKFCFDPNFAPQYEHSYFRIFKWVTSTCLTRLYLVENSICQEGSVHLKPYIFLTLVIIIRKLRLFTYVFEIRISQ